MSIQRIKPPYITVQSFLDDFRSQRYPQFFGDCRLAFKEMKQHQNESAVQFFFRFKYLLEAMNRDVEQYWDDFLDKLAFPQVRKEVRFWSREGHTVQNLASHVNSVENEMGVRRSPAWHLDNQVYAVNSGDEGRGSRSDKALSHRAKTDLWKLDSRVCWHCFKIHSTTDKPCRDATCLFCSGDHLSVKCWEAPTTYEAFKEKIGDTL